MPTVGSRITIDPQTLDVTYATGPRAGEPTTLEEWSDGLLAFRGRQVLNADTGEMIAPLGTAGPSVMMASDGGRITFLNAIQKGSVSGQGTRYGQYGAAVSMSIETNTGPPVSIDVAFTGGTAIGKSLLVVDGPEGRYYDDSMAYTGESNAELQARLGPQYRNATANEVLFRGVSAHLSRMNRDALQHIIDYSGVKGYQGGVLDWYETLGYVTNLLINEVQTVSSYVMEP